MLDKVQKHGKHVLYGVQHLGGEGGGRYSNCAKFQNYVFHDQMTRDCCVLLCEFHQQKYIVRTKDRKRGLASPRSCLRPGRSWGLKNKTKIKTGYAFLNLIFNLKSTKRFECCQLAMTGMVHVSANTILWSYLSNSCYLPGKSKMSAHLLRL